jgi:hypothetical protein
MARDDAPPVGLAGRSQRSVFVAHGHRVDDELVAFGRDHDDHLQEIAGGFGADEQQRVGIVVSAERLTVVVFHQLCEQTLEVATVRG